MFTGLVEQVGRVLAREDRGVAARLRVGCSFGAELELGESVAVNGVCLTVTSSSSSSFDADASAETLRLSTLAKLRPGAAVNLERATRANARLGGHVVLGHVDGIGSVEERIPVGAALDTRVAIPRALAPFVATKGSIAIDGVSLTVNEVDGDEFGVNLIPHTQQVTTLGGRRPGQRVNLEIDQVARYVERLLAAQIDASSAGR